MNENNHVKETEQTSENIYEKEKVIRKEINVKRKICH